MGKHVPQEHMVDIRSYPSRELFSPLSKGKVFSDGEQAQ